MRRWLCGAAILVCLGGGVRADETLVTRFIEFRDGSFLRLPVVDEEWKVTVVRTDGKTEPIVVRLSTLERLTLLPEPAFERKRVLLEVVKRLGADRYLEREQAQEKLVQMGAAIRADLEGALEVFTDPEVRSRIEQVLMKFPPLPPDQAARIAQTFDSFVTKETLHGDAGQGKLTVKLEGQTYPLLRKDIRGFTTRAPDHADLLAGHVGPAGFRRIEAKDFPPGCVEEAFETAPGGRRLTAGENIEKLFVSKGFVLSTSIATSHVSVNDFTVHGKSRGLSAATHQPLFQGEVTIRFCKPGHENIPAGVTHFGLWIAHVMPRGTMLVAYDLRGRELGNVQTTREGHEFLAFQSSVPVHRIKVVPNLQIDPDFTLDDFLYLPARSGEAHPEQFLARFEDGDRVLCKDVSFGPQRIRLHGMPAGLPDRTRPVADVLRVAAPDRGRSEQQQPRGVFVELRDGSVIFGTAQAGRGAPVFARRQRVLKESEQIVGLWSSDFPRTAWPAKTTPPVAWDPEKRTWESVTGVSFDDEAVTWDTGGRRRSRPYLELTPLLLREPAGEPAVGSWRVRTTSGEEIALGGDAARSLSGTLSRELQASWSGAALKVPAVELVSVYRVVKEP